MAREQLGASASEKGKMGKEPGWQAWREPPGAGASCTGPTPAMEGCGGHQPLPVLGPALPGVCTQGTVLPPDLWGTGRGIFSQSWFGWVEG